MDCHMMICNTMCGVLSERHACFLAEHGLRHDGFVDQTVLILDELDHILACGSIYRNVLKLIAVTAAQEGDGLCAQVVSALVELAAQKNQPHLFLYTKPELRALFRSLGFYPIVATDDMLMMENRRNGIASFLEAIPRHSGRIGCIACNCNPFTLGHRKLIEVAASACDFVYVFVLSSGNTLFPADVRYRLVRDGTADIPNVLVLRSEDYLISPATFPTYFVKDEQRAADAQCALDLALFSTVIAPALGITDRFVGQEPFDAVTAQYNEAMKRLLPQHGIAVHEIARHRGISAGAVRQLLKERNLQEASGLLPEVTYEYCKRVFG